MKRPNVIPHIVAIQFVRSVLMLPRNREGLSAQQIISELKTHYPNFIANLGIDKTEKSLERKIYKVIDAYVGCRLEQVKYVRKKLQNKALVEMPKGVKGCSYYYRIPLLDQYAVTIINKENSGKFVSPLVEDFIFTYNSTWSELEKKRLASQYPVAYKKAVRYHNAKLDHTVAPSEIKRKRAKINQERTVDGVQLESSCDEPIEITVEEYNTQVVPHSYVNGVYVHRLR